MTTAYAQVQACDCMRSESRRNLQYSTPVNKTAQQDDISGASFLDYLDQNEITYLSKEFSLSDNWIMPDELELSINNLKRGIDIQV